MKFSEAINKALKDACSNKDVIVCGQLVKQGQSAGITSGLPEDQTITYPVSEALMNSSALGLALSGKRPVVIHERMEFMMVGPDALINFIPLWPPKPIVIIVIVGKGKGQGPQQSKNFTSWFKNFEGWRVVVPESPEEAYQMLVDSISGCRPVMYVAHRELFELSEKKKVLTPDYISFCGASERHEKDFYGAQ